MNLVRRTIGMLVLAAVTGVSSLGQNAIQQTVTYGLDEAMNLDTGFERSKREGFFRVSKMHSYRM